ncbi:hypothetical protein V6C03_02530 [Methyloligella sp. 2.7D]|uniref:hypothetical protein n=1 Tax=unclassified Methyloligella TaxID=2625955 RepID=UPI00157DA388|nr:hypothetical protein [Methyloligella sp. GL2]QKP76497.1 hypothetical protein HT051_02890 [Methyloligella sp. GL2]
MRRFTFASLILSSAFAFPAVADESTDSGALALTATVGELSPDLGEAQKKILASFLDGKTDFDSPKDETVSVSADEVRCHTSNVDLTVHGCELSFGKNTVTLNGRAAHELLATLAEEGVEPDPGAGNIWYGISKLACSVDVDQVKEKAGGGVRCTFNTALD